MTISIVGTGNVAYQLGHLFSKKGFSIIDIYGRSPEKARRMASQFKSKFVNSPDRLTGDLIVVCISDSAIPEILKSFNQDKKVVYTSGPVHLNSCGRTQNTGVLYPLQTLQKKRNLHTDIIPFLIEAQNIELLIEIQRLAESISNHVYRISSDERLTYHLSAIWLNNFTNHMVYLSKKILVESGLDFNLLQPLLLETTEKIRQSDPKDAQTGPALRHDSRTLELHESLLTGIPLELYKLISMSISKTYPIDDQL
jgi:predicted short-subunit dehydrogenase-like oxidoreductase (DUF2520 family)